MIRRPWSTGFIDLLINTVVLLILMIAIPKAEEGPAFFGITMKWDENRHTDLDIYVLGPDRAVVWYQGKDRGWAFLNKDDLGNVNDRGPLNEEKVEFRSPPDGTYWVSVHNYRENVKEPGTVSLYFTDNGSILATHTMPIMGQGEEVGVWKIEIQDGKPVSFGPSSLRIRKDRAGF